MLLSLPVHPLAQPWVKADLHAECRSEGYCRLNGPPKRARPDSHHTEAIRDPRSRPLRLISTKRTEPWVAGLTQLLAMLDHNHSRPHPADATPTSCPCLSRTAVLTQTSSSMTCGTASGCPTTSGLDCRSDRPATPAVVAGPIRSPSPRRPVQELAAGGFRSIHAAVSILPRMR